MTLLAMSGQREVAQLVRPPPVTPSWTRSLTRRQEASTTRLTQDRFHGTWLLMCLEQLPEAPLGSSLGFHCYKSHHSGPPSYAVEAIRTH